MFSKSVKAAAALGLCASTAHAAQHNQYTRHLKFKPDGTFKIVTFSDLALSDIEEDYLQSQSLIETVLNQEKPDLVVLTGDIVDPSQSDDYAYHFSSALELIKARSVPWVWTGGNKIEGQDGASLHEIDYSYGMNLSWTGYVWDMHLENPAGKTYEQENLGWFTSRIPILDPTGKHEVLSVYTLDTSNPYCQDFEYNLPGESCTTSDAIDWFADQQFKFSHKHHMRDFVFLHKPIPEFMNLANLYEITGHKQQAVSCSAINTGLFATGLDSKKVVWVNAGFDADNDFSGRYHSEMMFSYARKSGFGGSGSLPRGVRSFRLTQQGTGALHGNSYIIDENGKRDSDMVKHSPPNFGFSLQTQCSVDPFAKMFNTILEDPKMTQE